MKHLAPSIQAPPATYINTLSKTHFIRFGSDQAFLSPAVGVIESEPSFRLCVCLSVCREFWAKGLANVRRGRWVNAQAFSFPSKMLCRCHRVLIGNTSFILYRYGWIFFLFLWFCSQRIPRILPASATYSNMSKALYCTLFTRDKKGHLTVIMWKLCIVTLLKSLKNLFGSYRPVANQIGQRFHILFLLVIHH